MHSFHPSRPRIFFEAVCLAGIAASLAGAWQQTGASALLAGSAAAALFALSHAFTMRRGASADNEPQRIDFEPADSGRISFSRDHGSVQELPELLPEIVGDAGTVEPVDPPAPKQTASRRTKAAGKSGPRRPRETKAVQLPPADEAMVAKAVPRVAAPVAEEPTFDDADPVLSGFHEDPDHPRIEPLFEPDPYFRHRRAAFGRKAG